MTFSYRSHSQGNRGQRAGAGAGAVEVVGKRTLTESLADHGGVIQRRPIGGPAGAIAAEHMGQAAVSTGASSGGGAPIEPGVRGKMERSLGADFSAVRVHEGAAAPSIGAAAFTHGHNIHFAPGRYQPHSAEGQQLLGHELAHVVQQAEGRASGSQSKGAALNADPALEAEADAMGDRAAAGEPARSGAFVGSTVAATAVQRQPFDFQGRRIDPSDEDGFEALVHAFGQAPGGYLRLPALHDALLAHQEPEAAEYVATYMRQMLRQPMRAPDQLQMEAEFRGVLDELWQATAQSGNEHGGILRENRATRERSFAMSEGADQSHFQFNFSGVQPSDNVPAIAHTHPSGSAFSGADVADQHRSRASVEYVRTATTIFAIVKSGEYWNRIGHLMAATNTDAAGLANLVRRKFNEDFDAAATVFVSRYQRAEDETEDHVVDLCLQFATWHATRVYAQYTRAGFYKGDTDADTLTRIA